MKQRSSLYCIQLLLLASLFLGSISVSKAASSSGVNIVDIYAVDQNENVLDQFESGQYVRIYWKAKYNPSDLPDGGTFTFSATASISTSVLGKKINYKFALKNIQSSGLGAPTLSAFSSDGASLSKPYETTEYTDLLIPEGTPSGSVTIEITGTSSLKNVNKIKFKKTFKVV